MRPTELGRKASYSAFNHIGFSLSSSYPGGMGGGGRGGSPYATCAAGPCSVVPQLFIGAFSDNNIQVCAQSHVIISAVVNICSCSTKKWLPNTPHLGL